MKLLRRVTMELISTCLVLIRSGLMRIAGVNSLFPGRCNCNIKLVVFIFISKKLEHSVWNLPHMNDTRLYWWLENIGLTHWGRVTHINVSKLTIIGSDNGLSPGRRQAIIWTNAGILLIGPIRTNFSEILIEINTFSFKKMHLKMTSGK